MKLTRQQLKQVIKEEVLALYETAGKSHSNLDDLQWLIDTGISENKIEREWGLRMNATLSSHKRNLEMQK